MSGCKKKHTLLTRKQKARIEECLNAQFQSLGLEENSLNEVNMVVFF